MNNTVGNHYVPDYVSPPGETLLDVLEERGMSQAELAERTGRPKKTISEIIDGKAAITPDMALQLERVLETPARFWNEREKNYQDFLARQKDFRMKGKNHDKWTLTTSISLGLLAFATDSVDWPTMTALLVGNTFGGLWLSPDLDLKHSRPSRRWWIFGWYWDVYRALCGKHRSGLSHTPIIGSVGRLTYLFWPFFVFEWINQIPNHLTHVFVIGVFISELVHLICDFIADNTGIGK